MKIILPDAPEILVVDSEVHGGVGHQVELDCVVHSEPAATVSWYKDTMLLDDTDNRRRSQVCTVRYGTVRTRRGGTVRLETRAIVRRDGTATIARDDGNICHFSGNICHFSGNSVTVAAIVSL